MREIKFRYRIKQKNNPEIRTLILPLHDLEFNFYEDIIKNNWEVLSKDQFTGLKDKNGKEIYERDIVNCRGYQDKIYSIGEVYWSDITAQIYIGCHYNNNLLNPEFSLRIVEDVKELEVIGNIYENPELLTH